MANAYNPILLAGTQAQFDALAGTYVEGKLYFVTDTGKLYRANSSSAVTDFTDDIVVWPAASATERPASPIVARSTSTRRMVMLRPTLVLLGK